MSVFCRSFLACSLTVALGGCLLPQPDTPPIRPVFGGPDSSLSPIQKQQPPQGAGAPGSATLAPAPDNGSAATGMQTPTIAPHPGEPGRLVVQVAIAEATAVVLTSVNADGSLQRFPLDRERRFETSLPPGHYWVSIESPKGSVRLALPLEVVSGETRRLTLSLSGEPPVGQWEEAVPLEAAPSTAPEASASPDAVPKTAR